MVFAIWAVLLLIASSLLAVAAKDYEDIGLCSILDAHNKDQRCEHVIVGAVSLRVWCTLVGIEDGFFWLM